jgi:tripartite-type tricarboxylate transporter receptor subunit TctC
MPTLSTRIATPNRGGLYRLLSGFAALTLAAVAQPGFAQDAGDYPAKPIRLVVPTAPGGGNDTTARAIADGVSKTLGQPIVVENIPGAGNVAGTAAVAKAAPDGYTLLSSGASAIAISPFLIKDLPYKPTDLTPVIQVSESSHVLVVNPEKVSATSLEELVKLLKENPDKYNYGSNGVGSNGHLVSELFLLRTGTKMVHVPFKGGNEVLTALLGGHIDVAFLNTTTAAPQIEEGKLKPLAVATPKRTPELPDVPAVAELYPDFGGISTWTGIFVPAGTPKPIVDKLNGAIGEYLKSPAALAMAKDQGATIVGASSDAFAEVVKNESATWGAVIQETGIKLE